MAVEPPEGARRRLLGSAARLEEALAWERELRHYRAPEWGSRWESRPAPLLGWMTLSLSQSYLLGFPKPRFSW